MRDLYSIYRGFISLKERYNNFSRGNSDDKKNLMITTYFLIEEFSKTKGDNNPLKNFFCNLEEERSFDCYFSKYQKCLEETLKELERSFN